MKKIVIKIDSFNRLLKSLTKTEKRYLKIHFDRESKLENFYKAYYFAYEKSLNETKNCIYLPNYFPIKRMPAIKNYLKEKILSELARFHQKSTKRNEILEQLIYIEVYFNKRLYKECASLIKKIELKALKYWSYNLLLEIFQWQLRLLLSNGYNNELKISLSNFHDKESKLLNSLSQISNFREIRYELLKINSKNSLTNPVTPKTIKEINNILFKDKVESLLPYALIEYNRTMSLYYRLIRDFEKAVFYSNEEIKIWDENSKVISDRILTSKYINCLINHCEILFILKDFELCNFELKKLLDGLSNMDSQSNNHIRLLTQAHLLMLKLNIVNNNFTDNTLLIFKVEKIFLNFLNKEKKAEVVFFFAANYFYQKKWDKSLGYVNKIINESVSKENSDINCFAYFFQIIIHFEIMNLEIIENLISKFKFDFFEMNLIFKYLLHFSTFPFITKKDNLNLLKQLKMNLSGQKKNFEIYHYFDFIWWVKYQISKFD